MSKIKPPALEISIAKITGDQPVKRTTLVSGLRHAITAKIGVIETNKAMIIKGRDRFEVSLSQVATSANSVKVVRSPEKFALIIQSSIIYALACYIS